MQFYESIDRPADKVGTTNSITILLGLRVYIYVYI